MRLCRAFARTGAGGAAAGQIYDCAAILAEVQANNEKVKQLESDKGLKTAQNVAAGVAGVFIPVLWFGMDFQGTADAKISAETAAAPVVEAEPAAAQASR